MNYDELLVFGAETAQRVVAVLSEWVQSPAFYVQLGAVIAAIVVGAFVAMPLRRLPVFRAPPSDARFAAFRSGVYRLRGAIIPFAIIIALMLAASLYSATDVGGEPWLIRAAEGLALVALLYSLIRRLVGNAFIRAMGLWVGLPVAFLAVFGWLDDVTGFLDGIALSAGNIKVSLYGLTRAFIFGSILFWLGRLSNVAGKEAIRRQEQLDLGTREVFAKLFEIGLFVLIFLLLLQIMGISLTALAVFGGALGVGLGFGLQQIASNFVSGIIILLDRSLAIGDHVELEDGRSGTLRELNMRFGVLETYDGKDVVVPNEQFITATYTNWTHKDPQQRYAIEFQVAYTTDLDALFDDLRELCTAHPQVLSGSGIERDHQPDAEVAGFGDNGIDILVEYWMEGIDDGPNRVEADLLLEIYRLFRRKGYAFPFPQREVRLVGDDA
ncbi:MAG: mechanosensitive ion channel domain-containing protein [Pseudomonadota bacterium]